MSAAALYTDNRLSGEQHRLPLDASGVEDIVLGELGSRLFLSLPRSDQRRRGMHYLQALIAAEGRKSIRNIAAVLGGSATEQSLHHFVASSTWGWTPVRRALAEHVVRVAPPQAWVARSMVIPKAGENSVGVERQFLPYTGQVLNAQYAVGVWAASEAGSFPVNWRLHLSDAWLEDGARRTQASIPDAVASESPADCAHEAYLGMMRKWGLPDCPVILDGHGADAAEAAATVRSYHAAGVQVLARVPGSTRLDVTDPLLRGRTGASTAHQIMAAARDLRRPVAWRAHGPGRPARRSLVAAVRTRIPSPARMERRHGGELVLLGVGEHGRAWPGELWLTNMTDAAPSELLRLTRLVDRVDHDFREIAERVGIRDYTGRSFAGWHRHVTLASAAHTVVALSRLGGEARPLW
ncbi:IS701 family transposase [Streptomyces sp. NPDC012389]|uniref:IS701 family transposase n=1 Tax=unclassified Streptomyces TaxID=2593676 RepID=UPI00081EA7DF|nr:MULTISPECIES: transposase [unclassified Streptomyces]MYR94803.1 transposase [Streptomyces sp. SID4937]SCD78505.1 SRSO17 transposase [Streptomyces sp. ScaeMP-e83]